MGPVFAIEIQKDTISRHKCKQSYEYLSYSQKTSLMDKRSMYLEEISDIQSYQEGWDGEGGKSILDNVITISKKIINYANANHLSYLSEDDIVPYGNGTLALHFKKEKKVLSFYIGSKNSRVEIKQGEFNTKIPNVFLDNHNISDILNDFIL